MKKLFLFIFLFLLNCSNVKSLNIPIDLIGKELKFSLRGCDYTQTSCVSALSTQSKPIGDISLRFTTTNIYFDADDSVKKDGILGKLFSSLNDIELLLRKDEKLDILDNVDIEAVDYEEKEIGSNTYVLLLSLDFKKSNVEYKQMLRVILSYTEDTVYNSLDLEYGLDVSTTTSIKPLLLTGDYPRDKLHSFRKMGRYFVGR